VVTSALLGLVDNPGTEPPEREFISFPQARVCDVPHNLEVGVGHLQERRAVCLRVGSPGYQIADDVIRLDRGIALDITQH